MRSKHLSALLAALFCLASTPAMAYVGPGAGLTLLSALWGLLIAVLAAAGFLLLWPIRRWRRRRQAALEAGGDIDPDEAPAGAGLDHRSRRDIDAE